MKKVPRLLFSRQPLGARAFLAGSTAGSSHPDNLAIAEVYPTLWSRDFANEGRTGGQHDAFSIAARLTRADREGSLAGFLSPISRCPNGEVAQVDGFSAFPA